MSELYPGLPAPPPPPEALVAAAVLLWRPGRHGREIFWVRRGALRFAGGFQAFPGGRLDPADRSIPVRGLAGDAAALAACAARELFEETGVLVVEGPPLSREARDGARRALLDGRLAFEPFLAEHGLTIDASRFAPAGRWITPVWSPIRYDARMFLTQLPAGEEALVWPGELESGEWLPAVEALARWERGDVLLHPPNLWGVQCVARGDLEACLARLRAPPASEGFVTRRIEFQRGIFLAALRTPTLPPATHTNAWIVALGSGHLAVVDPGSPHEEEQAFLERVLQDLAAEGLELREIWLTHAHRDHVGGVAALREGRRLVLRAHPDAAARLPREAGPATPLADGERLGGRFKAFYTPGHAAGHMVFLDERSGALLAGDMVSTLSTIVIDPPEGDMTAYLKSLERLRDLGPATLFPAHGAPTQGAVQKLEAYLGHRRERERKVAEALAAHDTLEEITAQAYSDTPAFLHPVAARSCLASLEKLAREGRAHFDGLRWESRERSDQDGE
jgi:glyoxylase-like metal-dependent hydrolase (beta-lactamase superfamily II)/8-oxo-dGTP pyrophosphatase MutT (NUDIX family)